MTSPVFILSVLLLLLVSLQAGVSKPRVAFRRHPGLRTPPFLHHARQRQAQVARAPHRIGTNCRISETGEIIAAQVEREGALCRCPSPHEVALPTLAQGGPTAICVPLATASTTPASTADLIQDSATSTTSRAETTLTTTPAMCVGDNGERLTAGQQVTYFGPLACKMCTCSDVTGVTCQYRDCVVPSCVDYIKTDCCYRCPNGSNCRVTATGDVIATAVQIAGYVCWCPWYTHDPFDFLTNGGPTAICEPLSPTSTVSSVPETTSTVPGERVP